MEHEESVEFEESTEYQETLGALTEKERAAYLVQENLYLQLLDVFTQMTNQGRAAAVLSLNQLFYQLPPAEEADTFRAGIRERLDNRP